MARSNRFLKRHDKYFLFFTRTISNEVNQILTATNSKIFFENACRLLFNYFFKNTTVKNRSNNPNHPSRLILFPLSEIDSSLIKNKEHGWSSV